MELERALEAGVSVIVIEPEPLGEETARWIYVGNLLHKVSVYSGLCGIASGIFRSLIFYNIYLHTISVYPFSNCNYEQIG